jgi:hypothetical protein
MPGPLAGYRVVDLSTMISGPMATMLLGDQGADVIKVEAPGSARDGISATFATTNRNKRSIVLDLKDRAGRETFDALVATADVFVQNFRPGVAERMGIGEASLRALRPDLVYVSICGFGETGPYARKRVYDPLIQALSGLATIQGDRGVGRPRMVRLIVPDKVTALTAAQAITAALLARERTGEGQHVRLSMIDAMVALAWPEGMAGLTFVEGEKEIPRNALAQDLVYETADGWMTAGAVSDSEWQGLARALEHPEWLEDDRCDAGGARGLCEGATRPDGGGPQDTHDSRVARTPGRRGGSLCPDPPPLRDREASTDPRERAARGERASGGRPDPATAPGRPLRPYPGRNRAPGAHVGRAYAGDPVRARTRDEGVPGRRSNVWQRRLIARASRVHIGLRGLSTRYSPDRDHRSSTDVTDTVIDDSARKGRKR